MSHAAHAFADPVAPGEPNPSGSPAAMMQLFEHTAFFSLFSVPNPGEPDVPIPAKLGFPFDILTKLFPNLLLAGVEVNEQPLRFVVETGEASCQLLATNQVGGPIASVHIHWTPIPWDYNANPNTNPPQTILNPLVSQRFEMLDGQFRFVDGSGFNGFGSGRTFPNFPRGLDLKIGAVINILEGVGRIAGHTGLIVVNGQISPPQDLDLNLLARIYQPPKGMLTNKPLPPLGDHTFPDPEATFMMFRSEPDPERPATLRRAADGTPIGLELHELLRSITVDFDVTKPTGPVSRVQPGPFVGRASSSLFFPFTTSPTPIPAMTQNGNFTFYDKRGREIGSIQADLVEGRGFPTELPGTDLFYRMGGFGPVLSGTGQFAGAKGMLSVNGAISFLPRAFSNVYVFRFVDPDNKFKRYAGAPTQETSA